MLKSVFKYDDSRIVEVLTSSDAAKTLVEGDVRWYGDRLSLQGGRIIIDFGLRAIIEEPDAALTYAVKVDGREVAGAKTMGGRRIVSAKPTSTPGAYTF